MNSQTDHARLSFTACSSCAAGSSCSAGLCTGMPRPARVSHCVLVYVTPTLTTPWWASVCRQHVHGDRWLQLVHVVPGQQCRDLDRVDPVRVFLGLFLGHRFHHLCRLHGYKQRTAGLRSRCS
jgi:hypothetical protein